MTLGTPATNTPVTTESLRETVGNLEEQLVSLYEERENAPSQASLEEMVRSLEAQVGALLEERNDLAEQLARA